MLKEYCGSCGGATSYDSKKPTFCASCGQPFGIAFAKTTPVPIVNPSPQYRPTARPVTVEEVTEYVPEIHEIKLTTDSAQVLTNPNYSTSPERGSKLKHNPKIKLTDIMNTSGGTVKINEKTKFKGKKKAEIRKALNINKQTAVLTKDQEKVIMDEFKNSKSVPGTAPKNVISMTPEVGDDTEQ